MGQSKSKQKVQFGGSSEGTIDTKIGDTTSVEVKGVKPLDDTSNITVGATTKVIILLLYFFKFFLYILPVEWIHETQCCE